MAAITLTISDADLSDATYKIDFHAAGTEIDDGQATAAYFTGFYLYSIINTPEFISGIVEYGQRLIASMKEQGVEQHTNDPAKMFITLTDADLAAGRFDVTLTGIGGDESGESLPTPAQVVGAYARSVLNSAEFREQCWAFAEEFASNNGATVTNLESSPAFINDDEDAARAA